MYNRRELEKRIDRERQKAADLRSQLEKQESFVQGLQEALRFLPKEGATERNSEQQLRAGSELAKARDFLREKGKPTHISEILKHLGKELNKDTRASLAGSLGHYARKGEIFTRPAPNTFGLTEFEGNFTPEPPDDFGTDDEEVREGD
jgi:hypothetical protein